MSRELTKKYRKQTEKTLLLRVGTDCSGIEAPIQALKALKIPFKHVFASDINPFVIQSIKANYKPDILFGDKDGKYPEGDITLRDNKKLPSIDLYIAGFPCQPFSTAGKGMGFYDERGVVFLSCYDVIIQKKPKIFILENVKGILINDKESSKDKYGRTWKLIWQMLKDLSEYDVDWKLMNTKDYGIPHNRERVYIIGVKKSSKIKITWPKPIKMKSVQSFVDTTDRGDGKTSQRHQAIIERCQDRTFIDFSNSKNRTSSYNSAKTHISCMTVGSHHWCIPMERYMNAKEYLQLQGFPKNFNVVVSKTQLKRQLGNSMSVNVLIEIFKCILI
jgi:DNA (cytosine-5)-methyltransferase 1